MKNTQFENYKNAISSVILSNIKPDETFDLNDKQLLVNHLIQKLTNHGPDVNINKLIDEPNEKPCNNGKQKQIQICTSPHSNIESYLVPIDNDNDNDSSKQTNWWMTDRQMSIQCELFY